MVMKTRILSALAVLACVTALSACGSGKHAGPADTGTGPAAAVTTQPGAPGAPQSSGSSVGSVASSGASENPDSDLSSLDKQLSDLDSALGSAAQSPSDDG